MEKSEALNIARSKFGLNATNRNSHFSKVNASKDVWWIEVSIEKITDLNFPNLYFLLQKGSSIDVLDIPTEFLRESADGFRTRTDKKKNCMCFEIDILSYKDVVGPKKLDLRQFLVSP